jgi:hypothetical protein
MWPSGELARMRAAKVSEGRAGAQSMDQAGCEAGVGGGLHPTV